VQEGERNGNIIHGGTCSELIVHMYGINTIKKLKKRNIFLVEDIS
jgi:hypothetical protein